MKATECALRNEKQMTDKKRTFTHTHYPNLFLCVSHSFACIFIEGSKERRGKFKPINAENVQMVGWLSEDDRDKRMLSAESEKNTIN